MAVKPASLDDAEIHIKTWTVQQILAPLIKQVAGLVDQPNECHQRFRSKSSKKLLDKLTKAIKNFEYVGHQLMNENPDMQNNINSVLKDISLVGNQMTIVSKQFIENTRDTAVRSQVADCARKLLFRVTRLLVLADLIDGHRIIRSGDGVVEMLQHCKKEKNLEEWLQQLQKQINDVDSLAERRQKDLINGVEREQVAVLRNSVKQQSSLLKLSTTISSSHRKIRDVFAAQLSKYIRDLVSLCTSSNDLTDIFKTDCIDIPFQIQNFIDVVNNSINSKTFDDETRPKLELLLEDCIRDIGLFVDSSERREEDSTKVANLCNSVRQALQDLLKVLNVKSNTDHGNVENIFNDLENKCAELLKKIRKILTFQYNNMVVRPARSIQILEKSFNEKANCKKVLKLFQAGNHKLIEISNLMSTFTSEPVYKRCISIAVHRFATVSSQLAEVVRMLTELLLEKAYSKLWAELRALWIESNQLLFDAVDESCRIEYLLSSCDHQILDSITECLNCIQWKSQQKLGEKIALKAGRLLSIVNSEMNRYETGEYTQLVYQAIHILTDEGLHALCAALKSDSFSMERVRDKRDELVHATNIIYDGVREIRCAVLMNSALELPSDSEEGYPINHDEDQESSRIASPFLDRQYESSVSNNEIKPGQNECIPREVMRKLPQEEMEQIEKQVKVLKKQKRTFDREVLKWDEKGNDIVMLARKMCVIMMEMSDFTRGEGPLRGTMDVINAAKKISDYGARLDKIARNIALECVESQSKQDLLAYLDRISLFTHQLNITSRVKADVQNISGELIVSGLDSAISLITSAKNLMNAVIVVVKASYIASTKYRNKSKDAQSISSKVNGTNLNGAASTVQWHMKPPEKKPLFIVDQDISVKGQLPISIVERVTRAGQRNARRLNVIEKDILPPANDFLTTFIKAANHNNHPLITIDEIIRIMDLKQEESMVQLSCMLINLLRNFNSTLPILESFPNTSNKRVASAALITIRLQKKDKRWK
ncbi:hypothetical protein GJ496_000641 [Pomphorhynchus laevis]|nr:hypothetical protein GJ496_000641 [Pomphorhynchus laevis]